MRLAIYPAQGGKRWQGDTLERESLGGSETAVIYTARGLAKLGHEVLVFTRGKSGVYDDVVYVDQERARNTLRTLPLDALICSRDPLPLIWSHRAPITALWHHDLPFMKTPDSTIDTCVSVWQANLYVGGGLIPKERVRITANGIDTKLFGRTALHSARGVPEVPKLAWTSNPERGLWHAGAVLQKVRERFPKAELHVWGRNSVYGWDSSYERNFLPDCLDGVILHDSLPKAELASALAEMDLFLYPTWWPETYCIAAVEAQAAGLPVVGSGFGALLETVKGGVLVPGRCGDPVSPDHLNRMAGEVIDLLVRPERRELLAGQGRAYAQTQSWDASVNAWNTILNDALMKA